MAPSRARRSIAPFAVVIAAAFPAAAGANVTPASDPDVPTELIDASSNVLDVAAGGNQSVLRRLSALRGGSTGVDLSNLTVQVGDDQLAGTSLNAISQPLVGRIVDGVLNGSDGPDRFGVFTNGAVRVGKPVDDPSMTSQPRATDSIDLTTGIDYRALDGLVIGASGGYSHNPERGALDVSSWRGSLYGTYFMRNRFHVDASFTYGESSIDSTRLVATDPVDRTPVIAKASADGRQLCGVLAGAFDWTYGPWAFTPRIGAQYLDAEVDRLDEAGGGDYDVSVGDQSARSLRLRAGAQLGVALHVAGMVVTPKVDADYVHDLAGDTDLVDVRFNGDPLAGASDDASVRPTRTDPGYFVWSVGATAQLMKAVSAFVSYRTFAGAATDTTRDLAWGVRFTATP